MWPPGPAEMSSPILCPLNLSFQSPPVIQWDVKAPITLTLVTGYSNAEAWMRIGTIVAGEPSFSICLSQGPPPPVGQPCSGNQARPHLALAVSRLEHQGAVVSCLDARPGSAVCNSHPFSVPQFPPTRSGDTTHSSHLTGLFGAISQHSEQELALGTCWPYQEPVCQDTANTL